jgi:hypothetical protein
MTISGKVWAPGKFLLIFRAKKEKSKTWEEPMDAYHMPPEMPYV